MKATFKARPEDFVVTERPLFEPDGEGDHLHIRVRKTGVTTHELVGRLARGLDVDRREIGYAGLKDKQAVAEQSLSLPGVDEVAVRALELPGVEILACVRHRRKLRRGQSAGNGFRVVLRDVDDVGRLRAIVDALERMPNYFGPQRFGVRGCNHLLGAALLRRDWADAGAWLAGRPLAWEGDPRIRAARAAVDAGAYDEADFPAYLRDERAVARHLARKPGDWKGALRRLDRRARGFAFSALQSYLFNCELDDQVGAGRRDEFGQLPGWRTLDDPHCGDGADAHRARLEAAGLDVEMLRAAKLKGERRRLWLAVPVALEVDGADVALSFDLPKGSYATALIREITRDDPPLLAL